METSRARWNALWLCFALLLLRVLAAAGAQQGDDGGGSDHGSNNNDPDTISDPTTNRRITKSQLEYQLKVAEYVCVAGLTLYAWEYLMTIGREISMWLHPRSLLHPQVALFLLIRYVSIPPLVVTSYSLWGHFAKAEECLKHEQMTVAIVQFVVSCVFSWRTIAIWRRKRWVIIFMIMLSLVLFGTTIGLLYFSRDSLVVAGGACRPAFDSDGEQPSGVNTVKWFYLCAMIFDTVAMGLSTYKLFTYANMGRRLQKITFRDPFEMHRQQLEKSQVGPTYVPPDQLGTDLDPYESECVRPMPHVVRRWCSNIASVVLIPYHKVHSMYNWWMSLTPLVARLLRNGIVFFVVATAHNVNNFVLEARNALHSKSFLALYSPLMCVLCQRMLLREFDEVWSSVDVDLEYPGRQLVDRVVGPTAPTSSQTPQLDRFERFASALEERHASLISPTRRRRSDSEAQMPPSSPPSNETVQAPSSAEKEPYTDVPNVVLPTPLRNLSFASIHVSPRTSNVFTGSMQPPAPVFRSFTPPKLTYAQEQQALRMAGLF